PRSIGRRVSSDGTSTRSSMARIIPPPRTLSSKPGEKCLAISVPRSFLLFFPTKTCAESAEPWHRSPTPFSCQRFAANAQPTQLSWQKFCLPMLHHSPTPLAHQLVMRSIKHARNDGEFLSPAHCISPAKPSLTCKANRLPSKNARSNSSVAALYERRN